MRREWTAIRLNVPYTAIRGIARDYLPTAVPLFLFQKRKDDTYAKIYFY